MIINVFEITSSETENGFNEQYLEFHIIGKNENGDTCENIEFMRYSMKMIELWKHLSRLLKPKTHENVESITLNFNNSDIDYVFSEIAQINLLIEMHSFMYDMENCTYTPLMC